MKQVTTLSNESARRSANRANSGKSTGPRTEAGKAVSSQNARTHGLCSFAVLEDEDAEAFSAFRAALLREYQPATPTESLLVEHIAQNQWLLDRVRRREAVAMAADPLMAAVESFKLFHRYASGYQRALYKAIETLRKIQAARPQPRPAVTALGFVPQNTSVFTAAAAPDPSPASSAASACEQREADPHLQAA